MSLTIPSQVNSLLSQNRLRFASCWEIIRTDGVKFYFTNHDSQITFILPGINGTQQTFTPAGSFDQSAQQKQADLASHNRDLLGILTSNQITNADLAAGLYREAQINEYLVDWRYPYAGPVEIVKYWIIETTFGDDKWNATVEGIERFLKPAIGDRYTRNCRFRLGDGNCGVDLSSVTTAATSVAVVINNRVKIRITDAAFTAGYTLGRDQYGFVTWATGANSGTQTEIILDEIDSGDVLFTFAEETGFDIQIGDTFTVTQGCDRLKETCRDKFSNINRHGGFPFIPTRDTQIRTPLVK